MQETFERPIQKNTLNAYSYPYEFHTDYLHLPPFSLSYSKRHRVIPENLGKFSFTCPKPSYELLPFFQSCTLQDLAYPTVH